jgi:HK97 family phage major capsid protein
MSRTNREAELIRSIDAINSQRPNISPAQHAQWEALVTQHEDLCRAQVLRTTTRSRPKSSNGLEEITQGIRRLARVSHRTAAQNSEFSSLCRQSKSMNEAMRLTRSRSADPAVRRSAMTSRSAAAAADLAAERREKSATPAPAPSYAEGDRRLVARAKVNLGDSSTISGPLLRDIALRDLETRSELSTATVDKLDAFLRDRSAQVDGGLLARHIIVTGRPAYRSAWLKSLTSTPAFTPAERHAIDDYHDHVGAMDRHAAAESSRLFAESAARGENRAMTEGTPSAGGFAIPYYLDASLVVVAGGVESAQILNICKSVLTTGNNYHWWATASEGFATQSEGDVVADESPTFSGGNIPVYAARDFIPFSISFGMDQPGWADNAVSLFSNAYNEFISAKTATGSGTSDVTGVFTALTNATNNPSHVTVGSAGSLTAADARKAWTALPERYRVDPSCAWLMSPSVESQVAALAAPSVTNGLSVTDLTTDPATGQRRLFGKPILSVSDAPAWTGTSGSANIAVVGQFNRYAVATRLGGFAVELVPLLRDPSTGRPTGERAFLATARVGGDVIDPNAFRILSNS